MRRQLVRNRLHFGREHASLSRDLPIELHLYRGARDEILVNLAIALRDRVGSLPAYQGDIVVETVVPDGIVVGEQLALGGQLLGKIRRGRVRSERFVVTLV